MSDHTVLAATRGPGIEPHLEERLSVTRGSEGIAVAGPPLEERLVALDPRDARLLARAREAYRDVTYSDCTHARLANIARRVGVEFATAFFYDRVRRAPATRAFLDRLDRLDAIGPAPSLQTLRGRVLIAPGAFYREHPRYGSDGRVVREAASSLGLVVESIGVPSLGTVRENAAIIRQRLAALDDSAGSESKAEWHSKWESKSEPESKPEAESQSEPKLESESAEEPEPVVLVSLSKGGADVRLALEQLDAPPRRLRAWINICGLVHGTPVADRVLASWWRHAGAGTYIALRGGSRGLVRDLAAGPAALLAHPAAAPPGVLVINIVGFPLRRHLFGITRLRHRFMASRGPSDGLALLRDEIVEPGVTLPVWGTDHYFRLPGIPDVLHRLFRYLGEEGVLHAHDA